MKPNACISVTQCHAMARVWDAIAERRKIDERHWADISHAINVAAQFRKRAAIIAAQNLAGKSPEPPKPAEPEPPVIAL